MRTTTRKGGTPTSVPDRPRLSSYTVTTEARQALTFARQAHTEGEAVEALARTYLSRISGIVRSLPPIEPTRQLLVVRLSDKVTDKITQIAARQRVSRSRVVEALLREFATRQHVEEAINAQSKRHRSRGRIVPDQQ